MAVFTLEELKEALGRDVDEAFELKQHIDELLVTMIKPLEDRLVALKNKVERNMKDEGINVIEGAKGRAKWVTTNRKSVDIEALCKEHSIDDSELAQFTRHSKSKYIKISKRA